MWKVIRGLEQGSQLERVIRDSRFPFCLHNCTKEIQNMNRVFGIKIKFQRSVNHAYFVTDILFAPFWGNMGGKMFGEFHLEILLYCRNSSTSRILGVANTYEKSC